MSIAPNATTSNFFVRQPRLFISPPRDRPTDRRWGPRSQSRISRSTNSSGCLRRRRRLSVTVRPSFPASVGRCRNLSFTGSSSISNAITLQGHRETDESHSQGKGRLTGNENELRARWMAPVSRTWLSLLCSNLAANITPRSATKATFRMNLPS